MERGDERRIRPEHRDTIRDILARLNASAAAGDMDLPGFRLHRLKGEYAGFRAVTVRANWRVIFRFEDGHAADIDYLDYHQKGPAMLMHNPPHPGEFIRRQCLEPLGLTVTEAAKGLAVSRNTLSLLLNGRLGISPEMAIRLSQAFGGSPQSWLQQQMQYDLWHAQQNREEIAVRKFAAA